jgi:hypothetical protein
LTIDSKPVATVRHLRAVPGHDLPMRRTASLRSRARLGCAAIALCLAVLAAPASCTAVRPAGVVGRAEAPGRDFSHAELGRVQARFVDDRGLVDYAGLAKDPAGLERFSLALETYSPDSHPELFPTDEDALAYWINAYNGSVLSIVIAYYPIASVTDVEAPFPLGLVDDKLGFFVLQTITLGGDETNLYALENSVIRGRYREPRVHFALNCASRGCPRLPREAFDGARLDAQLDRETRRFFAEERNLRIDHTERVVHLSSILDWYDDDFIDWMEERRPQRPATLLEYASLYVSPERAAELARARDYEVRFAPYDWSLNDQAPKR